MHNLLQPDVQENMILASPLVSMLEVLYTLIIDYRENGATAATGDVLAQLKRSTTTAKKWANFLPDLPVAVQSAISGNGKIEALVSLGTEIKERFQDIRAQEEFTTQELKLLQNIGSYLRTDSPNALATVERFAGVTESPWIARKMKPEVGSQDSAGTQLRKLVKKMVGRDGTFLTLEEAKLASATYPEVYREYLMYSREFNKVWKNALVEFVRQSGQRLVPYADLLAYLDGNGIIYRLPHGFTGLVDDQGRFYTRDGELINGVPSATTSPEVKMNPKYGPESPWVFQALKSNGAAPTYFYTEAFSKAQARQKFAAVKAVEDKLPKARARWFQNVKNFDPTDTTSVASVILELLWQFAARIGSPNNPTFGISTLQMKHIHPRPNGDILIAYKGKDGVPTKHLVKKADAQQKFLVAALNVLTEDLENRPPKEAVFKVVRNGRATLVGATAANRLFKSLIGESKVTVHKIRTYAGTKLFTQLMNKALPELSPKIEKLKAKNLQQAEKTAMAEFTKLAQSVGKLLNHVRRGASGTTVTGLTAVANYIDFTASLSFFQELGIRAPALLERFKDA